MQNLDVAHQFFKDINGSFSRRSMTVSYEHNKYWSYATVIAKITHTITGKTVCILSDNKFSATTTKHISDLKSACPFDIVYLPQRKGQQDFNAYDTVKSCIDDLEYYSKSKLTQKSNRENFSKYFYMLQNTLELEGFEKEFEKTEKALSEHRALFDTINNPKKLKEYKQKQQQREKKKSNKC